MPMESAGDTAGAASGIRIDGVDLHVTEAGTGSPVLLIHASGFDGDWPPALLAALAADHRVIAYDRRGYSRSQHPPIRDYHRHAEDAAALLHERNAAPATVVGYSAGGLVALDLAVGHPDLVTSLLLVEPPLYGRKHIDFSMARAFLAAQVLRRLKGDVAAAERFIRWTSGYATGGTLWDEFPEETRNRVRSNATVMLEEMRAPDTPNLARDRLATISCPVTCVTGELSQRWFHKTTREVQETVPQTKVRAMSGVSHALAAAKPVDFARLIHEVAAAAA
jgi:pimeloyl-ACP methyl ester carboxylesterase